MSYETIRIFKRRAKQSQNVKDPNVFTCKTDLLSIQELATAAITSNAFPPIYVSTLLTSGKKYDSHPNQNVLPLYLGTKQDLSSKYL